MLSFNQAHLGALNPFFLEHPLSQITLAGSQHDRSGTPSLCFKLVSMTCVGDMVDSQVMALTRSDNQVSGPYDLFVTPEEITRLWGPTMSTPCMIPRTTNVAPAEWAQNLFVKFGWIYKPHETSEKMHWQSGDAFNLQEGVPFLLDMKEKIIIGASSLINESCPTKPDKYNTVSRSNICSELKELGTWPAKWELRERQGGFQGGQFLNANFNATWIKSDSRTRKRKELEEVDLDFLNKP
jgi:hypothetical protein